METPETARGRWPLCQVCAGEFDWPRAHHSDDSGVGVAAAAAVAGVIDWLYLYYWQILGGATLLEAEAEASYVAGTFC